MKEYREKLKLQNVLLLCCIALLAGATVLGFAAEAGVVTLNPVAGDSHWQSKWRGFLSGASMGVMALMIVGVVRNRKALRSEEKLKKQYIKDHDERMIQIWTAARAAAFQTVLLVGLAAIVVAGYFSITVSLTILAWTVLTSVTGLLFKIYYSKKF